MKYRLTVALMMVAGLACAEESKEEWSETTLKDETIQKIQQAQYTYKKCVVDTMQKPEFAKMESRNATDVIIKSCEPTLGEIRKVYADAEVPGVVADRHLKKMRIQVTRNLLQQLMYAEAAKKAGMPSN
ncbi:MAG: hypothetical protein BVN35_00305 [Proteobacteria bacterium ST_bin11]|jgi:hypothetical protein|nr:MAG: hypothetical protein BVN35_00305 [Proteobacteria bacterium ST_bin11]